MNILISGLTGAGKTTYSKQLSIDLGLSFVSGSEIRSHLVSGHVPADARKYWLFSEEAAELNRLRLEDPRADVAMDARLQDLLLTTSDQVFDVWFLPWLVSTNCLKIWLECPLDVRARRIHHSLGVGAHDAQQVLRRTSEKDISAQKFAYKTYGVDIFTDRSPFAVIISTEREESRDLVPMALRTIAKHYSNRGKNDRELSFEPQGDLARVICHCPPDLYPA